MCRRASGTRRPSRSGSPTRCSAIRLSSSKTTRFRVALDTFYDRRNASLFMVNPIGGFRDVEISDEGNPNSDWNPVWDVRDRPLRRRVDRRDGDPLQVPPLSIGRRHRSGGSSSGDVFAGRNESSHLTPVPISAGPGLWRLSEAATLTGIEVPPGNRRFEVKPYTIGSLATDINAVPRVSNQGDGAFGFDVKYGVDHRTSRPTSPTTRISHRSKSTSSR